MDYRDFISTSLTSASRIARNYFGKVSSWTKESDSRQVLTKADLEISEMLISEIESKYPDHNIIDEEFGVVDKGSDHTWVIDPIDGTSNFSVGLPMYGIAIGLLINFKPYSGGIAIPEFSEIYYAEQAKGAFCNNEKLWINKEEKLINTLIAYGIDPNHEEPGFTENECIFLARLVLNIRNLRSSNSMFDTAMLLKGKYGAYINRQSKIWDNVAQHIIVEEAGGVYTNFYGNKQNYTDALEDHTKNYTFIATTPFLFRQLIKLFT